MTKKKNTMMKMKNTMVLGVNRLKEEERWADK